MDSPFVYDKYVTGKNFIGRKEDCNILANLLSQREHVALWEPARSGKMSLVQQTLFNMRIHGRQFSVAQMNLLDVRDLPSFLRRFGAAVLRSVASTPSEYEDMVRKHLEGTNFVFDGRAYSEADEVVSLSWEPDADDLTKMLNLPWALAAESGRDMIVIISEFQNLDKTGAGDLIFKAMQGVMTAHRRDEGPGAVLLMLGSQVNAMKDIFQTRRFFYRRVEHFGLSPVDPKEIVDYIVRGFLSSGKVVERELLLGVCGLFRCNLWYINQLISVADSLSKGYIVESTLMDALESVLSLHEPRFMAVMNDLTAYQVSLLRALLDGHSKFSSAEVIRAYGLSSSANVKRLKEALKKKEIVTFGPGDEPRITDPLFEYWVRNKFFRKG